MSEQRQFFGLQGEEAAKDLLLSKGYKWLDSNFRTRGGEIDLVMEDKNMLVFVEVKHRQSNQYGLPEEAITPNKIRHMTQTALFYVKAKGIREKSIRFDVVTIDEKGTRHYVDAFQPVNSNYYY